MYIFGLCALFISLAFAAENLPDQLKEGLCLCIEDNDVFARSDPGSDNPIVGVLKKDNCFISSGGMMHNKGVTWYEAHTVEGKNMWIDGFNLRAVNMTDCTNPRTTSATTTTVGTVPTTPSGQTTPTASLTTTIYDPFAGGLDFCFTADGQIVDSGKTHAQNGVICKCVDGSMQCPSG